METECWQALWVAVMGWSKSSEWRQEYGVGDKYPAYSISHTEASQFSQKLNQLLMAQGNIAGYEVRLPTESQWEYAIRAGSTADYCFGNHEKKLEDYAWYEKNSGFKNHVVGTKLPNLWGIHDGHGSVWEWCSDWYDSKYPNGTLTDPIGPSRGSSRVLRGGGFDYVAEHCKSGNRNRNAPSHYIPSYGFRVALSPSGIPKSPEADK